MNTTQNQSTGPDNRSGSTQSPTGNGESIKQASDEIKQGAEELRSKATAIAQDAKQEGKAQVDEYRDVAANKVDTIAESVKAAAVKLDEGDAGNWSKQIAGMADIMTSFSQGLREKSADEVLHDVNRLARENPAIFIGSAVAIGFGLTRLMRASEPSRSAETPTKDEGYDSTEGDAYTSSTITGGTDPRLAGMPAGTRGSDASSESGAAVASGSNAGAASAGTSLGGAASSNARQSGFPGSNGSPANASARPGEGRPGDNDRSTSS